ncbi:MRPL52 [Bugula neritina]|uniref:Large ribosomal subunit protein mL52 n=1 Tax=Bugula neritina TaxID=10212 RepID=A0A7J7JPR5_BUGNE|nr:MRPL52 [Bugula neritina]
MSSSMAAYREMNGMFALAKRTATAQPFKLFYVQRVCFNTSSPNYKKIKKFPKHVSYYKIVSEYELDRIEKGLSRTGSEYGPLTDKPDWSFADGRAGYMSTGQRRRQLQQRRVLSKVASFHDFLADTKIKDADNHNDGHTHSDTHSDSQSRTMTHISKTNSNSDSNTKLGLSSGNQANTEKNVDAIS